MTRYIIQRLIYMVITMFLIATLTFFLMKFLPGTPLSAADKLSEEQQAVVLEKYGLNDPVPVQYFNYMTNLVQGDLGISFQFDNREVTTIIMERIGPSMQLGVQAMFIGTIIGILLGLTSAIYHNGMLDYSSTFLAVLGQSIPSFVFAGLLQFFIGVKLGWLPVALWEGWEYSILPTISLAIFPIAIAARFMRTEMLEVMGSDYIVTARAKGVNKFGVVFKHGFRNALIPLITVLGPLAVGLMTGTLVIENIFAVPGIGEQFVKAINMNDFPIIMGTTLLIAFLFIFIILVIDLLYGVIDPRIRLAEGE
ncbi:oligopeptide transport system permease protein [Halobacillus karajensis]|uniref:Stage 0 sporulation protein KB n=1 Tax=Halobacillus karajensis TaxID=195088 RepID=A0A024P705_9BACI|nr:oligopeptide ABC transporter permease [Halobacillus karajensis]CDQ21027.1 Stage 0 sporulation protein KB [Halobacillus karajensis]CDQ24909.1 Stage 0 sporulation protein KB [Halobacillus karajensis]CDQ28731.1 Stage 0 sporulation protein KB [Halobacillus karajensis]SEH97270.1 oligopeptide transport system permease protein [Halobacillus karajensis]